MLTISRITLYVTPLIVTTSSLLQLPSQLASYNARSHAFQLEEEITTLDASAGVVWKNLRKNMSPTFTSGKLKGMMEPMTEVIDRFMGHLDKMAGEGKEVEVKPILQGAIAIGLCVTE